MKVFIVYPHGLGDCILATPALREYKLKTNNWIGFAMLQRFKSSMLFQWCPYIDQLFYTKDAWNDYPTFEYGCRDLRLYANYMAKKYGYQEVIFIHHGKGTSKILDCAKALGVEAEVRKNPKTEIFIAEIDKRIARDCLQPKGKYGFVHSYTGVTAKDLPMWYGRNWLKKQYDIDEYVDPGVTYNWYDYSINVGFALLEKANAIVVSDSVYYHAAGALNKPVDLAYFAKGPSVYERVKPLHNVPQNIVYKLEDI